MTVFIMLFSENGLLGLKWVSEGGFLIGQSPVIVGETHDQGGWQLQQRR